MSDIFDQVQPDQPKDIFDQVAPEPKQDIFDKIISKVKQVGSKLLTPEGITNVPTSPTGVLTSATTAAVNKINATVDPSIEKFRSETLPNAIAAHAPDIFDTISETGHRTPMQSSDIAPITRAIIPTTKEAALGVAGGSLIKSLSEPIKDIFEKISPSYAADRQTAREVASLGNIQQNNLVQPQFKSTEVLGNVNQAVEDKAKTLWKPAWRYPDGKIEQTGLQGHNMFAEKIPGRESGFLDENGSFVNLKDIGDKIKAGENVGSHLSTANTIPQFRQQVIRAEMDGLAKKTVGDLSVPKELNGETSSLPGVPKRSFISDALNQVLPEISAIKRQGLSGSALASDIENYTQDSQIMAAKVQVKTIPDLLKLPEEVRNQIPDYLEPRPGQQRPILAGEAKRTADQLGHQIKVCGRLLEKSDIQVVRNGQVETFHPKNEFFPRALNRDAIVSDPKMYQDEVNHLVDSKQVASPEEGKAVLDAAIKTKQQIFSPADFQDYSGSKKLSTIERPRIYTFKNVTNDPIENWVNYTNSVFRRFNEIRYFGQSGDILKQRLASIGNEGGDANFVDSVMTRFLKQGQQDTSGDYIVKQLRAFQGATKLGLSAIPNMQQGVVNSYIKSQSEKATLKGFAKAFTKEGLDFATKAGVVDNAEVDKYLESIAGMKSGPDATSMEKAADWVGKHSFFNKSETANRVQAATIGREYINELADKFIANPEGKYGTQKLRGVLENYKVDPDQLLKRGHITANEELKAANTFVGETQFGTKPLITPAAFNSGPIGKLGGQFSNFSIQQGKLVKDALLAHPLKTLPIVAGTSVGIGGPLGIASNLARGKAPVDTSSKTPIADFVLQSILNSGALGKVGSIGMGGKYGKMGVAQQLIGPTISDIASGLYEGYQAAHGKPKPLMKHAVQEIPIIGRGLSNVVFPPKKSKK